MSVQTNINNVELYKQTNSLSHNFSPPPPILLNNLHKQNGQGRRAPAFRTKRKKKIIMATTLNSINPILLNDWRFVYLTE